MDEMRPSPYRFAIGGAVLLLQFAMGLSFLAVAPLFPLIIEAYGVDRATASLLVGGTSLVLALAFVPCSVLAAKLGPKWALLLAGVLMSAVMLAPLATNFWVLLATRLSFAVGAAINMTTASTVVMRWFPQKELPLVNGLNVVGQSLGVTLSMMVGVLVADALGWRGTLFSFGAVILTGTVVWLVVGREDETSSAGAESSLTLTEIKDALANPATLLLGAGMAGGIATNVTFGSWLPSYYNDVFGFSLQKAGNLGALLAFTGIAGSLLGSALPFKVGLRRPFLMLPGLLMPFVALGVFMTDEPLILYPSLALLGILGWLFFPVAFTIPMELPGMTPRRVGMTVAMVLGIGNLSGFVAPFIVGYLRDQTGSFWPGFFICSAAGAALLVTGYLLPETGPKAKGMVTADLAQSKPSTP